MFKILVIKFDSKDDRCVLEPVEVEAPTKEAALELAYYKYSEVEEGYKYGGVITAP